MGHVISVFGSAQSAPGDINYLRAEELGAALARAGFTLCNGGYGGTMEAAAKGALSSGGRTIGVTIRPLRRAPNAWITKTIPMPSLIERLEKLVDLGDGYVVLSGGTGTLLELALVWEYISKHLMPMKPVVCFGQFWSPLVAMMKEQLRSENRIAAADAVVVSESPDECVRFLTESLR
jgi:uncharacterized protein (TIGR00730 family)